MIEKRREEILGERRGIRAMERGSIAEQYLKARRQGKKGPVLRGPDYLIGRRTENKDRMRCAALRERGLFVGSGVVEAGWKTVIGKRLKPSGMEWSVPGAHSIIAPRCMFLSGRVEEFGESRCA